MHKQFSDEGVKPEDSTLAEDDANIPKLERTASEPLPVNVLAGNKTARDDREAEDDSEQEEDESPVKRTRGRGASYIV